MQRVWNMLAQLSTPVLAVATLYLAFSAKDSAESARKAAETAGETVAAVKEVVELVRETANTASASVDITREWFELSQRPFINLGGWEIEGRVGGVVVIRGKLNDIANVPTTIEKVCVWSGAQQVIDSLRNYVPVGLAENVIAFMDHHQWVLYGPLPLRSLAEGQPLGYLSTVYTFSREGTSASETWRVDSIISPTAVPAVPAVEPTVTFLIRIIDMYRVEEATC